MPQLQTRLWDRVTHTDTEKYFNPKEVPVVLIYVYQILHFMADLTW